MMSLKAVFVNHSVSSRAIIGEEAVDGVFCNLDSLENH